MGALWLRLNLVLVDLLSEPENPARPFAYYHTRLHHGSDTIRTYCRQGMSKTVGTESPPATALLVSALFPPPMPHDKMSRAPPGPCISQPNRIATDPSLQSARSGCLSSATPLSDIRGCLFSGSQRRSSFAAMPASYPAHHPSQKTPPLPHVLALPCRLRLSSRSVADEITLALDVGEGPR